MPRTYLSARGEVVDFDVHLIKQQLATAPMTVDVEKRKTFIESKEVRKKPDVAVTADVVATGLSPAPVETVVLPSVALDFEPEEAPKKRK
jgi:hypothetical protein